MIEINESMFRAYDIRGRVNKKEMNVEVANIIGLGFGTYLARRGIQDLVVGHDSRLHSQELKDAFIEGAVSTGAHIIDIGLTLSPILHFAQYHFKTLGGAMITASHNPKNWNGVKLMHGLSKDLTGEDIQELYKIIKKGEFKRGEGLIKKTPVKDAYAEVVTRRVKIEKPFKIVVSCGNGTAGIFAPDILRKAGCQVTELFCQPDDSFPNHAPDPTLKIAQKFLGEKVKKVKADFGISYDGDGDRLGMTDELGNNIWSDRLLILLARQVLARQPKAKIIFDVKCTQALPEDIKKHGGIPIMYRTGHSYLTKKVREEGALLGGERSGHFVFSDNWYGFDDAIFASLRLIEYLAQENRPLSEIIKDTPFSDYPISPTIYIPCADDKKFQIVEELTKEFKKEQGDKNVIEIDGARVNFKDGWGLVRASSTEPALTVVIEAKTAKRFKEIKAIFKAKLKKYPAADKKWKNE